MEFNSSELDQPTIYTIHVRGLLGETWSAWLNGLLISLEHQAGQTAITITVPDQAALRGVVNKLWDSNLTLLSLRCQQEDYDV
jgi:hypothetical protein